MLDDDANTSGEKDGDSDKEGNSGDDKGDKEDKEGDDKPEGAPESYEAFELPEGFELSEDTTKSFGELAKLSNLPQADAQKFLDLAVEHMADVQQKQFDQFMQTRENWVSELRDDKEFGGKKFEETRLRAKRVMKTFGGKDEGKSFLKVMNESGVGDNPEVLKLLARIDKEVSSEDPTVEGKPSTDLRMADKLYPNS